MSSKFKVAAVLDAGLPKQKKTVMRDPRFDSLCGEFKEGVIFNCQKSFQSILTNCLSKIRCLRKRTTL